MSALNRRAGYFYYNILAVALEIVQVQLVASSVSPKITYTGTDPELVRREGAQKHQPQTPLLCLVAVSRILSVIDEGTGSHRQNYTILSGAHYMKPVLATAVLHGAIAGAIGLTQI